jgi:3-phosphoshikimate 1-carboxyvinyltransferase
MSWNTPPIKSAKTAIVHPLKNPLANTISVPGSKSVTNRAFLLAAAAQGTSTLHHFLKADDSHWCCDILHRLGVALEWKEDSVKIKGTNAIWLNKTEDLYLGDAGTLARFLPGLLAASPSGKWKIDASPQLAKRPLAPVLEALQTLGVKIETPADATYPFTVEGGHFTGGVATITGRTSSQFVSGLLLAAPLSAEKTEIIVKGDLIQKDYVKMTMRMMESFGVPVDASPTFSHFSPPPKRYKACDYAIEADASTASYFFALAAATKNEMLITNIHKNCLQPDIGFLSILEELGCAISEPAEGIRLKAPKKLHGNKIFDMEKISDTVPTLAAIAPFADGPIRIKGVAHIRHHESDRIHALYTVLTACGVPCEEHEDGLTIHPATPSYTKVSSFNDHRIAMSMAVMGLAGNGIEIDNPGCVAKTCPVFFELLEKMNATIEYSQ